MVKKDQSIDETSKQSLNPAQLHLLQMLSFVKT
jgi:hypothetical protein